MVMAFNSTKKKQSVAAKCCSLGTEPNCKFKALQIDDEILTMRNGD
jgi:hypothetical protein